MSAISSCKRHSDDSESEEDNIGEWFPGDGVCPSVSQFNSYFNSSYGIWSNAAVPNPGVFNSASIHIKPFLDLLDNVPSFFYEPPEDLLIGRGHECLSLRSSFQLQTVDTLETDCVERWRTIDYFQDLGVRSPTIYKITTEALPCERLPSFNLDFGYLSSITLAWSYIISLRWVEILKRAGWNSLMLHSPEAQTIDSFWNMIIQGHWVAKCQWASKSKAKEKTFYSPWMLSERSKKHIKCADWTEGPLNSTMAFNILLDFCISKNLEFEFITGFASVLMVTSQDGIPPPQLAPPTPITHRPKPTGTSKRDAVFHKMLETLDKSMFLSSTMDALDSLLCSAFFNPSVPCNLVGASSSGVKGAFHPSKPHCSPDDIDFRKLSSSIINQAPHLTPLWIAVICTRQAPAFINRALNVLPPICLPAAFWTDTLQSFLQLEYRSNTSDTSDIPCVQEFQTSYFCRPASSVPWSPAPPFGLTMIKNLSLEIREHLGHDHRPRSWRID
ncbi:hypothetical protein N7528_009272 [Penicillium herquei]|nr:hypothetical protein N7528_009272 [Penicillium herquei]